MAARYALARVWSLFLLFQGALAFSPSYHVLSRFKRSYHVAGASGFSAVTMVQDFDSKASEENSGVDRQRKPWLEDPSQPCACYSGQPYRECCKPFHDGVKYPEPQELMRARFAAYASNNPEYIMQTTHPDHDEYGRKGWRESILTFCRDYRFTGLEVDPPEEDPTARGRVYVYFTAMLAGAKHGEIVSLDEKSLFLSKDGTWYYREADAEFQSSVDLISKRRRERAARADRLKGGATRQ
ncbi:unnamed protein product [Sphacelaria rigidula]